MTSRQLLNLAGISSRCFSVVLTMVVVSQIGEFAQASDNAHGLRSMNPHDAPLIAIVSENKQQPFQADIPHSSTFLPEIRICVFGDCSCRILQVYQNGSHAHCICGARTRQ
jgi:hypothetical protein